MRLITMFVAVLLLSLPALADTHYVSKTGSNTPPYTSWATATDSILLAVHAADPWDTIRLAGDLFTADSLQLKRGQVLRGAGADSTTIRHNGNTFECVILADSASVLDLKIDGIADTTQYGAILYRLYAAVFAGFDVAGEVRNCALSNMSYGFYIIASDSLHRDKRVRVTHNSLSDFWIGIAYIRTSSYVVDNHLIATNSNTHGGIHQAFGRRAEVSNNVLELGSWPVSSAIDVAAVDTVLIQNNLITGSRDRIRTGIRVNQGVSQWNTVGAILNNTIRGGDYGIRVYHGDVSIGNNIIVETDRASLLYDTASTTESPSFNLFRDNSELEILPDTATRLSEGSLFADPMFADTIDYLLQAFSPAIDAGDPSILDADGSRSDIGYAGGPGGFSYPYQDLPPATPSGFTGIRTDSQIVLTWRANQEADFSAYVLFRTMSPPSHEPPFEIGVDTVYVDTIGPGNRPYSYAIAAKDAQNNLSVFSDILSFTPSGLGDDGSMLPDGYTLHPNYPNPFNASTRISYTLAQPGTVTLTIYDVLGRHVTTLVDDVQAAGEHSVMWHGKNRQGKEVGSGVYFYKLSVGGETKVRRMVVVK